MKISEHVHVLPIQVQMGPNPATLNLTLLLDEQQGATLVDTGIPGSEGKIGEALREAGLGLSDVKRVILTHQDIDHIGSLTAVKEAGGARVLALDKEVPFIQGEKTLQKLQDPEQRERRLASAQGPMRDFLLHFPAVRVDDTLHDGDLLPFAGGVRVIATPGHTVGHLSLFVEQDGVLIAGDALTSENGELHGPNAPFTPDMDEAMRSVQKLAGLPVRTIVAYHGGVVDRDAAEQLKRVAGQGTEQD